MKKSLLAVLMAAFITPAFADDVQEMMGKEKKVEQLASELGLTEEQKVKIQSSREKYKTQISEKETAFNSAKDKFTAAVANPNASTSEIESAYKQKEDAQRALGDAIFKSRMEFREVLTPEQRTKMISKREEMREKFHNKKEDRKEKRKDRKQPDATVPAPVPVK